MFQHIFCLKSKKNHLCHSLDWCEQKINGHTTLPPTPPKSGIRTRFGSALSKVVLSRQPGWYRIVASDGTFLGTDDKEGVLGGGEANMSSSQLCWFVDNKGKASSVPTKMGFHEERTLSATLRLLILSGKLNIYIYSNGKWTL